jgi:hypothetical protein
MTLTDQIVKNIIIHVIKSQDYRIEIVNLINAEFLQFVVDFYKEIVDAKLNSRETTPTGYECAFMNENIPPDEIQKEVDLTLTIKMKGVSVDLNISESLIVINTLAVKRSALRGGLWSTAGKSVEKYLMLALCKLYQVPESNYDASHFTKDRNKRVDREVDFYLLNGDNRYLCEVKLMGKGNPESADAIIARDSDVFVADMLSQQNKNQCDELGVNWVALRDPDGYKKFGKILSKLAIPHTDYVGELDVDLPIVLDELF